MPKTPYAFNIQKDGFTAMNISQKKALAEKIVSKLSQVYPNAECSLEYAEPYQLLIAVRLSAQCTDKRVNIVTEELFSKYPTLLSLAYADVADIEQIIRPCGLYKTKAASICALSKKLVEEFDSTVPNSMEKLLSLPGIGRKSANLILGDIYGQPAVVTDTHCMRICERLGLSSGKNPLDVEMQLRKILPMDKSNRFCHALVLFGRQYCTARSPKCNACPLSSLCKNYQK